MQGKLQPYSAQDDVGKWIDVGPRSRWDKNGGRADDLMKMVEENAVIVFARRGCCMSYVARRLLQVLGANPAVHEVEKSDVSDIVGQLAAADGGGDVGLVKLPAVFIGGRWFGGLERIIATHIKEELTPLLKQAGALWV